MGRPSSRVVVCGLAAVLAAATAMSPMASVQTFAQATTQDVPKTAPTKLPAIDPIPRPKFKGEFQLRAADAVNGPDEQWTTYVSGPIVRNVHVATLIPLLPKRGKTSGKSGGTALIYAPGGGFRYLDMNMAEPQRLADLGITVFVLKYRTVPTDRDGPAFLTDLYKFLFGVVAQNAAPGADAAKPLHASDEAREDGLAAVRLIRSRASEWHIDPAKIGFIGGSAGAMTAIDAAYTADASARPNFVAALFGPKKLDPVPASAPPLFVAASNDDPLFPGASEGIVAAWSKAGRPVEAHFYERGGHGLAKGTTGEGWFASFAAWMQMHGWLAAK